MSAKAKQRFSATKLLKRLIAAPFVLLAAVIILLEDWLWDDLARLAAAIGRLPILRQIEALIVAAAKIAGTALVARLFTLSRPKLLRIAWFAWLYERFIAFKTRVYAVIK